jgi:hypothetical protein
MGVMWAYENDEGCQITLDHVIAPPFSSMGCAGATTIGHIFLESCIYMSSCGSGLAFISWVFPHGPDSLV